MVLKILHIITCEPRRSEQGEFVECATGVPAGLTKFALDVKTFEAALLKSNGFESWLL